MGRPLALDGRHLMWGHNNQPKVVVDSEGGVGEETRPGRNVWGTLSHCLGRRMEASDKKHKKMGWALAIDGRRLNILHTTTNQKQAAATEGTMKGRHDEREARGKHDTIVFGRHYVEWRLKTKIKSLSLLIIFFLSPFILLSKTPRHRPRPTRSAEAPGGGAAQNIKAVPLDRRPAPPWCCSLLDGCCLE